MYGLERELKPTGQVFSQEDGLEAVSDAERTYLIGKRFLEEWLQGTKDE